MKRLSQNLDELFSILKAHSMVDKDLSLQVLLHLAQVQEEVELFILTEHKENTNDQYGSRGQGS
jgi:hypothetical protein